MHVAGSFLTLELFIKDLEAIRSSSMLCKNLKSVSDKSDHEGYAHTANSRRCKLPVVSSKGNTTKLVSTHDKALTNGCSFLGSVLDNDTIIIKTSTITPVGTTIGLKWRTEIRENRNIATVAFFPGTKSFSVGLVTPETAKMCMNF